MIRVLPLEKGARKLNPSDAIIIEGDLDNSLVLFFSLSVDDFLDRVTPLITAYYDPLI